MGDNPPSLHRYLYAYVNPTVYWDPDGREVGDWWDPRSYKDVDLSSQAASERSTKFLKAEVKGFVNAPAKILNGLAALPGKVVEKIGDVATHPIDTAQNFGKEVAQAIEHPLDSAAKDIKSVDDAVESYANSSIEHQGEVVGGQLFGVVSAGGAGKVLQGISEVAGLSDVIADATTQGLQEGVEEGVAELAPEFKVPVEAGGGETVQASITAESAEGGLEAGDAVVRRSTDAITDTTPNKNVFPEDPNALSEQLGVEPKVGSTPDGTKRMTWKPNVDTEIRYESHPEGLSSEDPGFNPRHHDPHYHVTTKPSGSTWNQAKKQGSLLKMKPENYTPGSGTGFLPGESFPGTTVVITPDVP